MIATNLSDFACITPFNHSFMHSFMHSFNTIHHYHQLYQPRDQKPAFARGASSESTAKMMALFTSLVPRLSYLTKPVRGKQANLA
jgi:hypothetical protein